MIAIAVSYAALLIFLAGLVWRVIRWAWAPVPFRIPTVCGQQKSLPWIKSSWLESPHRAVGVVARMALEVLTYRSLLRNVRSRQEPGPRLIYRGTPWLWLAALAFHWSLLIVLLRHLRLFVQPAPRLAVLLTRLDGCLQIGTPTIYVSNAVILWALLYLLFRRLGDAQVRYISLPADYFAPFLLVAIVTTGICMRYFARTDIVVVKKFAIGLATFAPIVPQTLGVWFYVHLSTVSVLAVYLPFSKLMHMGGVFLSPTRNLANNNRMKRHVNPWNYPVKVHLYEEWEDEFRAKMEAAGLPVEKR